MNGQLGALFTDKQIGGFFNWTVIPRYQTIPHVDNDIQKFNGWSLTAKSYFLFESPQKEVTVRLYLGDNYWEGIGTLSYTRNLYDTEIHEELEITGTGILEGK